ncbi:MAG TPA: hypothetical protein VGC80_08590 [Acetobacteraceae bacterium]
MADVPAAAEKPQLSGFVTELRKDITAVEAALSMPWTTSPAEGQISRIKMIKPPCTAGQASSSSAPA